MQLAMSWATIRSPAGDDQSVSFSSPVNAFTVLGVVPMSTSKVASAADYLSDGSSNEKKTGVYGLSLHRLSPAEVMAQSVAVIAPSASMAALISLAFVAAGNATWLSYAVAGIGLCLVGMNINQFARRSASPGSLYSYTTMGLGPLFGVMVGWGWLVAYLGCGIAIAGASSSFMLILLHSPTGAAWPYITFAIAILLPWYVAYRDVTLSAKLMLYLQFGSMALISVVILGVFMRAGFHVHVPQLTLQGFTLKGFFLGLVLAVFCNIGFESSTALGEEAKNPLKTIPRSVIGATVISSAFYVVSAFAIVGGFTAAGATLDGNADVLGTLANYVHMGWLAPVLIVMVLISALGCTLGSFTAGCHVLFTMARHGVVPAKIGGAHEKNETPGLSVTICAAISLFIGFFCMAFWGMGPTDILNDVSTMATYGFLVGFVLISLAAPVYLKKIGKLTPSAIVISALAMIFMVAPIVGSFYPLPDPPIRYYPYIFMGYLAVGVIWLFILWMTNAGVIQKIEADLEGIASRYGTAPKGEIIHAEVEGVAEPKAPVVEGEPGPATA
jgi:amino acid transporter